MASTEAPGGTLRSSSSLVLLISASVLFRAVPALIWRDLPIIRDEQSYAALAGALVRGQGIVPTVLGWLWAPLYPAFLALHERLFGTVLAARATQVALSGLSTLLVYRLGRRLGGRGVGLCAGWLYALEPTLIAFSHYLWTEHLYSLWLLLAVEGTLQARTRKAWWAIRPGIAMGLAALTRGVGTYAAPFLLPALLWGRLHRSAVWAQAGFVCLGVAVFVLPYSAYVSRKFGGLILVDTSVSFNMWLGNNEFEPVTFDYGMGGDMMSEQDLARLPGRPACWAGLPVAEKSRCEVRNGLAFIGDHPLLFVRRIWTREAQTFNPSSFLLRNLRRGGYRGMPDWARSALCVFVVISELFVVGTAALGAAGALRICSRTIRPAPSVIDVDADQDQKAALQATCWGITLYHLAASGALIGLSRFRLPLVPLWLPFSAFLLISPRQTLRAAFDGWRRSLFAAALLVLVMILSLTYVGRAFPALAR